MKESKFLEFPTQGKRYTWTEKHKENRIFSKIDYTFINRELKDTMPCCKASFLAEGISGHCLEKVVLDKEYKTRKYF